MATDILPRLLTSADLRVIKQDIGANQTLAFHMDEGASSRWTCLVSTVGAGAVSAIEGLWYVGGFSTDTTRRNVTTLKSANSIAVTATADGFTVAHSSAASVVNVTIVLLVNTCSNIWITVS